MIYYLASPQYLWLLILVPLLPVIFIIGRRLRRARIRRLGDESLVNDLMPSVSKAKDWARIVLFTLGFLFFVVGLCRPQIGAKLSEHKTRGAAVGEEPWSDVLRSDGKTVFDLRRHCKERHPKQNVK